ncbi:MAG: proton-conducting transporter membrane subunit [Myxococcota bacterium]
MTELALGALSLIALSGAPALFMRRGSVAGARVATVLALVGCGTAFVVALLVLGGADAGRLSFAWGLPLGRFAVGVDAVSAAFLALVTLVGGVATLYGARYWSVAEHADTSRKLRGFLGLCIASLGVVVIATDGVLFLVAWEIMALACFFLVTTEDEQAGVRQAGWLYLAATHLATLVLIAFFAVVHDATGGFDIAALPDSIAPGTRSALFLLALVAFGLKAGLMPLHVWLPSAHANAPSHVSALMSGVMIKMGIYGLVRFLALIPSPPALWGGVLLALGVASALAGVLFALGQHDLKRLLAYHSIENIGIIVMALGLAMLGRAEGDARWVALGVGGAVLHTWNHGLFKALLFLGAGAVIHAVGTREIDRMGGLARRMPWTAALFLVGALAICGLPPLNGFVSELLVYLGLADGVTSTTASAAGAALAVPALALVGALAVACFVKVFGTGFLGEPRTPEAAHAHEAAPSMLGAMGILAGFCVFIGVVPVVVAPALDRVIASWPSAGPAPSLAAAAPLGLVSAVAGALVAALGLAVWLLRRRVAGSPLGTLGAVPTWDCGYAAPRASMQYTGSSFADGPVRLFGWILRPAVHRPAPIGPMPERTAFSSHVAEPVLERVVMPALGRGERLLHRLHVLQQGRVQAYVFYVMVGLVLLFLWLLLPFDRLLAGLGARGAFP